MDMAVTTRGRFEAQPEMQGRLGREREATASTAYNWVAAALAILLTGGLYLDGWAHNHGKVDNTFFTPWHAILYGSMALTTVFLVGTMGRMRREGYALPDVLPRGYWLSALGVILFGVGGVADLIWHTLFGFEANIEALLSPTHLILATSGFLVVSGPLRAMAARSTWRPHAWSDMGPAILASTAVLALLSFFTEFAHPLVRIYVSQSSTSSVALGVAGILLQAVILVGVVLFLLSRWQLPVGSLTLIMAGNALFVSVLNDTGFLVPSIVVAGMVADLVVWRLGSRSGLRLMLLAFLVPVLFYSAYFAQLWMMRRVDWSIHLWMGSIVLSGIAGILLSFMAPSEKPRRA